MAVTAKPPRQTAATELAILTRVFEPEEPTLSPEAAYSLLALDFRPADRERMQVLAAKARAGTLSPEDQVEIDSYEKVGHILSLLKAKAKVSLRNSP
jgi:hypothetical protein